MSGLEELAGRKAALLARSGEERNAIARRYYQWEARSKVARQTLGILRNPLVLAALGLFVLKMPWKRAYKLSGWALRGWRLLRLVKRMAF